MIFHQNFLWSLYIPCYYHYECTSFKTDHRVLWSLQQSSRSASSWPPCPGSPRAPGSAAHGYSSHLPAGPVPQAGPWLCSSSCATVHYYITFRLFKMASSCAIIWINTNCYNLFSVFPKGILHFIKLRHFLDVQPAHSLPQAFTPSGTGLRLPFPLSSCVSRWWYFKIQVKSPCLLKSFFNIFSSQWSPT